MQDRLKRHVNSRALAFAAMSHDIRTPLTRMRLRLESLDDRNKAKLADDVGEIEAIAKSVLEVTRGLSPDEKMVDVDLGALVRRVLADYEMMSAKIGVTGTCASVSARPMALRRALVNLLDNALKHGNEVTVELAETREHVAVRVRPAPASRRRISRKSPTPSIASSPRATAARAARASASPSPRTSSKAMAASFSSRTATAAASA
jgi:signal transduction histidine kinase